MIRIVLILAAAYLAVLTVGWLFQRRLQYFPDAEPPETPPGVEEITLRAADGTALKAWRVPGSRDVTLLVLHGNAGHRGHRLAWIEPFRDMGYPVVLLDYRGYGGSEGSPSEEGLVQDAEAAAASIQGPVVYFAESIGCSVAVSLAARREPAALVLHAPALDLGDVAQRAYPFLPARLILRDRFDVRDEIAGLSCPVLVVHGDRDGIIPIDLGRAVYDAANGRKEFLLVEGAGHNDLPFAGGAEYTARVAAFLDSVSR